MLHYSGVHTSIIRSPGGNRRSKAPSLRAPLGQRRIEQEQIGWHPATRLALGGIAEKRGTTRRQQSASRGAAGAALRGGPTGSTRGCSGKETPPAKHENTLAAAAFASSGPRTRGASRIAQGTEHNQPASGFPHHPQRHRRGVTRGAKENCAARGAAGAAPRGGALRSTQPHSRGPLCQGRLSACTELSREAPAGIQPCTSPSAAPLRGEARGDRAFRESLRCRRSPPGRITQVLKDAFRKEAYISKQRKL